MNRWMAKAKQNLRHCLIIIMIILSFNIILRTSTVPIFRDKETDIDSLSNSPRANPLLTAEAEVKPSKYVLGIQPFKRYAASYLHHKTETKKYI